MNLRSPGSPPNSGAVLLEVLLAVALFVGAAAVATASLNASLQSLERQKLQTQASHLAASVLAEIQLGARPGTTSPAQPFEPPFEIWSWELVTDAGPTDFSESAPLTLAEVVIRHSSEPIVQRLAQRLPPRISTIPGTIPNPDPGGVSP